MKTLHNMQRDQPELFADLRFKIGIKGDRERSRLKHFGSYAGPDPETLRTLELNYQTWATEPLSFWTIPHRPALGSSTPGELVATFINAQSDDS